MKTFVKYFDMYSTEVYFTINNGKKRNQTVIGGILTLVSTLAMIILCSFFLSDFFEGTGTSVLSKDETTEDIITKVQAYPFMLRLSTEKVQIYPERERLYTITLKLKVGGGNNSLQWTDDIAMEPCDINKHFGNFAEMFSNMKDLNTFLCPIIRMENQTIVGVYGGEHLFQYYHFYITMCVNNTEKSNCLDKETMNKKLKATYLDVRTIDYNLNTQGKKGEPCEKYIRADRHSISNTVYKRVWMYYESINYFKDIGLFFENYKHTSFFKVNSFRYDTDIRDMFNGVTIPGTFANLSVLNYMNKRTYFASYTKAQEFFANIGGVTRIITVACSWINYCFSEVAYKKKIMKYILGDISSNSNSNSNNKNRNNNKQIINCNSSNVKSTSMFDTLVNINNSNKTLISNNQFVNTPNNNNNNNNNNKNNILLHNNSHSIKIVPNRNAYPLDKVNSNKFYMKNSLFTQYQVHNGNLQRPQMYNVDIQNKTMKEKVGKTNKFCSKFCNCELFVTKILCSKENRSLYFDNYYIINSGLDIVNFFAMKRKVYNLEKISNDIKVPSIKNFPPPSSNNNNVTINNNNNNNMIRKTYKQHHTLMNQNSSLFFSNYILDLNNKDN